MTASARSKVCTLAEAAALVRDGQTIAIGGNLMQRVPNALVRELARQERRQLEAVKTAGAYDIDLLCAAGCLKAVSAGFVGFENEFGLAPSYRRAVEKGTVEAREHACYTVIMSLRAAAFGLPFLPVAGFQGSDLPAARGFRSVVDPYSGAHLLAVPRLQPDWALVHVVEADAAGNGRVYGTEFEDRLMAQAARGVILTAERIVPSERLAEQPELSIIPGMVVHAVVEAPHGAWPAGCYPDYDYDAPAIAAYLQLCADAEQLADYLRRCDRQPAAV